MIGREFILMREIDLKGSDEDPGISRENEHFPPGSEPSE